MWPILASLLVMGVEYVYHNWIDPPQPPPPERSITIPLTTSTTPIALLYGRCRVTTPVLAYTSQPIIKPSGSNNIYMLDMMFVLGVPFRAGHSQIKQMYIGDRRLTQIGHFLGNQTGQGNFEDLTIPPAHLALQTPTIAVGDDETTQGDAEFLDGRDTQTLINPSGGAPTTRAGQYMTSLTLFDITDDQPWNYGFGFVPAFEVPGYRGYLSAFLWAQNQTQHWAVGVTPDVSSYSFEVATYPATSLADPASDDVNPMDVLVDLLVDKLSVPATQIDMPSFLAAAMTCRAEGNVMSIAFQQQQTVAEIFDVILRQVDGGLRWNPKLNKLQIKLIRADYDTATLPIINPDNCIQIQNFSAGGCQDLPNRVIVTFTDRLNGYKQGVAIANDQAVGDDGEIRATTVDMPGVCFQELADYIAQRILAAISRPLMQLNAIVNRSFLRELPGDAVKLNWPEANISNVVFRIIGQGSGTLEDGAIGLQLTQDYFYVHRDLPPQSILDAGGGVHSIGDEIP